MLAIRSAIKTIKDTWINDKKGWIAGIAALVITMTRSGLTFSFGLFISEFRSIYSRPMAELNWIAFLSLSLTTSLSPIPSSMIRYFGKKGYMICSLAGTILQGTSCFISSLVDYIPWLFLTYSFLHGLGSSLIFISASFILIEFFPKEHKFHVFVTAFLLCGYPLASMIFNPFVAWLIQLTSWKIALRVLGVVILVSGCTCSYIFFCQVRQLDRPVIEEDKTKKVKTEDSQSFDEDGGHKNNELQKQSICISTFKRIYKNPVILCWLFGSSLAQAGYVMPFFTLAHYAKVTSIDEMNIPLLLTILSFAECISYTAAAILGKKLKGKLILMNVFSCFMLTLLCFIWPILDVNYFRTVVFSIYMGVMIGLNYVYMYPGSGEAMEMDIDIAWTVTSVFCGIGVLLGPIFTGVVYDYRNSYTDVFIVVGLSYLVNFLLYAVIPLSKWKRQTRDFKIQECKGFLVNSSIQKYIRKYKSVEDLRNKLNSLENDSSYHYSGDKQKKESVPIGGPIPCSVSIVPRQYLK